MPAKIKNIFSLNYCTLPISLYLYQNIHSIFVSHIFCPAYLQNRDRAEGGAEGALAPPPLLFFKNKNQLNKKYFNKKVFLHAFFFSPPTRKLTARSLQKWKSGVWSNFSYSRHVPMRRDNKIEKKKRIVSNLSS